MERLLDAIIYEDACRSSGDAIRFNLADYFVDRHVREGRAHKAAIRCGESVYTYGDLAADINRAGNGLLRLGVQDEQRVLLLLPDCPSSLSRILVS